MIWLNIFRYFYLLGAVNALFFSILIFSKPQRGVADKIMGVWLIFLSLQLITPFLYLANLEFYYRFAGSEVVCYTLHPVFLYYYIRAITGTKPVFYHLRLFIVSSTLITVGMFSFFLVPAKVRFDMIMGTTAIPSYYFIFVIPVFIYFVFFLTTSNKLLRNYKLNILHVFSYRQNVDLLWLRRIFILFYSLLLFACLIGVVLAFYGISLAIGDYFYFVGLTIFIFLLGYWGYKQGTVFSFQIPNDEKEVNKDNLKTNHHQHLKLDDSKAVELKEVMENLKPYLNPTLTIYELASMVDIPPHQLSRLISKEFKSNFFEFVNKYRIESFKKLMFSEEFKDFTILAIAFECGFNSKSAFNRIFKDQTGLTPRDFKNLHSA